MLDATFKRRKSGMPRSVLGRAATTYTYSAPRPPFTAVAGAIHISIVHFHKTVQQILCVLPIYGGTDTIQKGHTIS